MNANVNGKSGWSQSTLIVVGLIVLGALLILNMLEFSPQESLRSDMTTQSPPQAIQQHVTEHIESTTKTQPSKAIPPVKIRDDIALILESEKLKTGVELGVAHGNFAMVSCATTSQSCLLTPEILAHIAALAKLRTLSPR
jgi:hypothetical protein